MKWLQIPPSGVKIGVWRDVLSFVDIHVRKKKKATNSACRTAMRRLQSLCTQNKVVNIEFFSLWGEAFSLRHWNQCSTQAVWIHPGLLWWCKAAAARSSSHGLRHHWSDLFPKAQLPFLKSVGTIRDIPFYLSLYTHVRVYSPNCHG